MRGVTLTGLTYDIEEYISTHTPHARRDIAALWFIWWFVISTHTPHARRDESMFDVYAVAAISTHTPHARRDE